MVVPCYTFQDVLRVKRALLTRIPYELVDLVLEFAEYWVYSSNRCGIPLQVIASSEASSNAKWIYMLSDPIPSMSDADGNEVPTKIKLVHFSTNSCDQGWVSIYRGEYRGSYSWFEASIIRPSSFSPEKQPPWLSKALHEPTSIYDTTLTQPLSAPSITELRSPYKDGNKRWIVQKNVQASLHNKRHDVVWYKSSQRTPEEVEYDEKTGSGRGLGFVDSLRAGDRIALVARARYPGWRNNVQRAEIEIAYQI